MAKDKDNIAENEELKKGRSEDGLAKVRSLFGSSAASGSEGPSHAAQARAFIDQGTKVQGLISFSEPAVIEGVVEGEVIAKTELYISEAAVLSSKVQGQTIVVKGKVNGDIEAVNLRLLAPAVISGNISAQKLSVEEGVMIEGQCLVSTGKSASNKTAEAQSS